MSPAQPRIAVVILSHRQLLPCHGSTCRPCGCHLFATCAKVTKLKIKGQPRKVLCEEFWAGLSLLHLMLSFLFVSHTNPRLYASRWRPAYLWSGHADAEQKANSECCPVKSLLTGGLWDMKSWSCSCMQTSKAEADRSDCDSAAVCFGDNRRLVCGLHTAEDNVGWQVCADQTLHRRPPSLPFLCPSMLPVHLGPPFGRSWPSPLRALCSFVRSGWGLSVCLHTDRVQLFTDWLCEHSRGAETEGRGEVQVANGSTMDRWCTKQGKM